MQTTSTTISSHANGWPFVTGVPDDDRIGIAFSGGGIRSAAFCLGAYQRLAENGIFQRAAYVSAVSGGGYAATAIAVSLARSDESSLDCGPPPWAHGSAEERYLRNNLSYLAPGVRGRLWLLLNYLYGLTLNLAPLLLAMFLTGRLLGLAFARIDPGIGTPGHFSMDGSVIAAVVALGLVLTAAAVVGVHRLRRARRRPDPHHGQLPEQAAHACLSISAALVVTFVVLPLMARAVTELAPRQGHADYVHYLGVRIWIGLLVVAGFTALGALALLLLHLRRVRRISVGLAWLSGLGALSTPLLVAAQGAAQRGLVLPHDLWVEVVGWALLLGCALFVKSDHYSLHVYYRERLSRAFLLHRVMTEHVAGGPCVRAEVLPYEEPIHFSAIGAELRERRKRGLQSPEFVLCAAVAAREGDVPTRSGATSFTFEGDAAASPQLDLRLDMKQLEQRRGDGGAGLTMPSIMAISGAAVSPLMGRFSLPGFRLLMSMLNIRLGVWLPNPRAGKRCAAENGQGSAPSGKQNRMLDRLRRPGAFYVIREGLGLIRRHSRYIHVSDGGHWENLGVVELIRRRCTHIVVLDASVGSRSAVSDIARAAAIARAELGTEVKLDPRPTVPDPATGLSAKPVVSGTVLYPDGSEGEVFYARCTLWDGAPADLHLYQESEPKFPRHPTVNQLLSGDQFEAYRALGFEVGREIAAESHIEFEPIMPHANGRASYPVRF